MLGLAPRLRALFLEDLLGSFPPQGQNEVIEGLLVHLAEPHQGVGMHELVVNGKEATEHFGLLLAIGDRLGRILNGGGGSRPARRGLE